MAQRREVQPKATEPKAFSHKSDQPPTILTPANDPPSAVLTLTLNGQPIRDRGEMLSLTDMWKAAGSDPSKRPADWSRKEGASFIDHMNAVLNVPQGHILAGERGRTGQTFGHWQIALAYAKYLSPAFHAACNAVIRERMEGRALRPSFDGLVTTLDPAVRQAIGGIVKGIIHREITDAIPHVVDRLVEQRLSADPRIAALDYVSVVDVLDKEWKVPPKGRRSIQRRVLNRLKAHCLANGIRGSKAPYSGTWIFPRHEAGAFIREHCGNMIVDHIEKVSGQGNLLRLVKR